MKLCFEIYRNQPFAHIKLEQHARGRSKRFRVSYGLQVREDLTYDQAAKELGAALMHHAACEGRLNNDERY